MTAEDKSLSLAVLIDADNASAKYAHAIFEEIAKFGEANVRRIYGDFSGTRLSAWNQAIQSLAILQLQQRNNTTGKNAADIALVIDAMDLMHKGKLDGFCLVSSDSDFTRLAQRLREENLEVFGFGEAKTPSAFINACNKFIYVENLLAEDTSGETETKGTKSVPKSSMAKPAEAGKSKQTAPSTQPLTKAVPLILKAMKQMGEEEEEDGWYHLGRVGTVLRKLHPDFDPRTYGCVKLSDLAAKTGQFQTKRPRGTGTMIARKPKKSTK